MFEARNVSRRYGPTCVLEKTDLSLVSGELTVIVGPNGAGKSTLASILCGESQPSSGQILLEGQDLRKTSISDLAERRAVLPQSTHLSFPFTVLEVVRLGVLFDRLKREEANALVIRMLKQVDLQGFAGRFYQQLSGGEQQRVQLARVLCQLESSREPAKRKALFLDEPVSSLDIRHQLDIMTIARGIADDGVTVLAILHDLNLAALFADRVVMMSKGRCVADGPAADVITDDRIRAVFGVEAYVNAAPEGRYPFVLPKRGDLVTNYV